MPNLAVSRRVGQKRTKKASISKRDKTTLRILFREGVLVSIDKEKIEKRAGGEPLVVVQCPDSHRFGEHHEHTKHCSDFPHPMTRHGGMLSFADTSPIINIDLYRSRLGNRADVIPLYNRSDVLLACDVKTSAQASVFSIHFPCAAAQVAGMSIEDSLRVFATALLQMENDIKSHFAGKRRDKLVSGMIPVVFICLGADDEEQMFFFEQKRWGVYCTKKNNLPTLEYSLVGMSISITQKVVAHCVTTFIFL